MPQSSGVQVVAGKQSLFAQAAMILGTLRQSSEQQVSRVDARVLFEVSNAIHDAEAWHRFAGPSRGPCPGEEAKETYTLLSRAAGPVDGEGWVAYWSQVRGIGCTLHVIAAGNTCDPQQVNAAEQLCTKASGMSSVPTGGPRRVQ